MGVQSYRMSVVTYDGNGENERYMTCEETLTEEVANLWLKKFRTNIQTALQQKQEKRGFLVRRSITVSGLCKAADGQEVRFNFHIGKPLPNADVRTGMLTLDWTYLAGKTLISAYNEIKDLIAQDLLEAERKLAEQQERKRLFDSIKL